MALFEPGPWDNKEKTESVHVFSKKRKLMYGKDHDVGEDEDYGKKELNKLHPMWRRNPYHRYKRNVGSGMRP